MVGTKCRVSFIQYISKKTKKIGINVWTLAEARSGYCLRLQVYTGKTDNVQEKGLSYRAVTQLLSRYMNKNHHLYFDNFFTTIQLLQDLATKDIFCCGTIRADRGQFPEEFKKCKLDRGKSEFISNGNNLLAVHWKHKREHKYSDVVKRHLLQN